MKLELHIENQPLDLTKEATALMTFSIDDIKDFSSRSTSWSKTIVLPGTSNNNKLFGHIFQIGQSNFYNSSLPNIRYNFNASKSANVILFQDQMQTFKGVLRLMEINYVGGFFGKVEYKVSIFGNLSGLNTTLTGRLLEQLNFSKHNQEYSISNITGSWDNTPGSGIYYPLIDYGNFSTNKHDWDYRTFRPAFFAKEYIDKIFSSAGYRYQCSLFNTERIRKLIIPHNQKEVRVNNSVVGRGGLLADPGFPFLYFDGDPDDPDTILFNAVPFENFVSPIFTASLGGLPLWGYSKFTYTDTPTVTLNIKYRIQGRHYGTLSGFQNYVTKNGDAVNGYIPSTVVDIPATGGTTFVPFTIEGSVNIIFNTGDYFEIYCYHGADGIYDVRLDSTSIEITSATSSSLLVPIQLGQTVICNDCIPKNIRQVDFLVWIVKLFNLYIYEDKNDPYLIYITPYVDYYSKNTSYSNDWTYKLDRSKLVKVKPMSELNAKIYKFRFKADGDYYNDLYKKRYNEGYGDRIYDSNFEFSSQTQDIEIGFSPTPLVGYNGEDKVYSTIFKRTGNEPDVKEENIDSNIRILQTKKITEVESYTIKDGSTVLSTLTYYGYAGHLNDPDVPSDDLNFGATKELFFALATGNLSNNQFNVYWSGYMAEITDKDSKLVTAYFKLDPKDIFNLDFSKYIYVDGIAFRLNQIKDYNAGKPGVCEVELFKVGFTSYTESTPPDGPPEGCYLLWEDEEILDADNADPFMYSDCQDNPGDGGEDPDPPPVYYLNWSFTKTAIAGVLRIYLNGNIQAFTTTNGETGSFIITSGDEIVVQVAGSFNKPKRILVTNDVDGIVYDNTTTIVTNSYTFTIGLDKNYSVNGEAKNS